MISIKDIIEKEISQIPKGAGVAVMLSGGIDSLSLLVTAKRLGYDVTGYTFTMSGHESTDLKVAREACKYLGLDHVTIALPESLLELKIDITNLIKVYNLTKKTEIECVWPFYRSYAYVKEKYILNGLESDKHFGLSKKARINHIHTVEAFDSFKRESFAGLTQHEAHKEIARLYEQEIIFPFLAPEMLERLCGHSWEELNKPQEKQPVRDLFDEEEQKNIPMRKHQNLQLGDSLIAEHFMKLLQSDWNIRGAKSVKAIYNDVINGKITSLNMDRQQKLF